MKDDYTIDPQTGCWLWMGRLNKDGYGIFGSGNLAHRAFYTHHKGYIRKGLFVCHRCDVRRCVNPEHLFLGTDDDNMIDMYLKGRWIPGKYPDTDAKIERLLDCGKLDSTVPYRSRWGRRWDASPNRAAGRSR